MARQRKPRPVDLEREPLGALIARDARVLKLLDKYGITFCAGCYLTLFAKPERAAVYHAVPHPKKFVAELKKLLGRGS